MGLNIQTLITGLLFLVVGLALTPTIQDSTNSSQDAVGATSAAGNLVELLPLFWVMVIVGGVVALIYVGTRGK